MRKTTILSLCVLLMVNICAARLTRKMHQKGHKAFEYSDKCDQVVNPSGDRLAAIVDAEKNQDGSYVDVKRHLAFCKELIDLQAKLEPCLHDSDPSDDVQMRKEINLVWFKYYDHSCGSSDEAS